MLLEGVSRLWLKGFGFVVAQFELTSLGIAGATSHTPTTAVEVGRHSRVMAPDRSIWLFAGNKSGQCRVLFLFSVLCAILNHRCCHCY